ncbi:LysR family transcriptional regulator [Sphingomonas sp. MAH-20]|uniref:LysR family transcriptional regulator n=1 Tax=Sphingomonas horti TaxID=2682842 RepID=A0A6I4J2V4_9SPHN|nr:MULTISPECIES: LysR substrate-binding domain-containing protein [Sphingomonas]MBA2918734.1 LysR family transcriptional regulator [Sphingomonas sp. CGMCC 1.13658]MVO78765.1 LysR family transcriptional regulator [Sphingomonas horti]
MRRLPPLSAVRVFEAAARHQNFTTAGTELGMTQAAVSYQIKLLEERLGVSLFRRERGRVSLSETGQRIGPLVAKAFDDLDTAFGVARSSGEGVLTVSCSTTFGPNWLASRIGAFQLKVPDIAVRLHTSNALVDFARDDVDVAIRGGKGEWPGLCSHFLMRMPLMALASPEFLERVPPVRSPDDVMRLPRISPDDSWWRVWREQVGGDAADGVPSGIKMDTQIAEGQAAIAGAGIAVLNPVLWRLELATGRLVPVIDAVAYDPSDFWLVYPEHHRHSRKIRLFRDWMLDTIAQESARGVPAYYRQAEVGVAAEA